jgi:hypothetical protein
MSDRFEYSIGPVRENIFIDNAPHLARGAGIVQTPSARSRRRILSTLFRR